MIPDWIRTSFEDYRGLNREIYLAVLARFINSLGNGTVYPFVTLYFYNQVGLAFTLVGTGLLSIRSPTQVGRRPVATWPIGLAARG